MSSDSQQQTLRWAVEVRLDSGSRDRPFVMGSFGGKEVSCERCSSACGGPDLGVVHIFDLECISVKTTMALLSLLVRSAQTLVSSLFHVRVFPRRVALILFTCRSLTFLNGPPGARTSSPLSMNQTNGDRADCRSTLPGRSACLDSILRERGISPAVFSVLP